MLKVYQLWVLFVAANYKSSCFHLVRYDIINPTNHRLEMKKTNTEYVTETRFVYRPWVIALVPRFGNCFLYSRKNYKGWCRGTPYCSRTSIWLFPAFLIQLTHFHSFWISNDSIICCSKLLNTCPNKGIKVSATGNCWHFSYN